MATPTVAIPMVVTLTASTLTVSTMAMAWASRRDLSKRHAPDSVEREALKPGDGKGKVLYMDCPSGVAGDMTIAGLLDLGVPLTVVEDAVAALGLEGITLQVRSGYAGAIGCTHFDVKWEGHTVERSFVEIAKLIEGSTLSSAVKSLALKIFRRLADAEAEVHRTTLDHVHFHEVGAVDAIVDIVGAAAAFEYLGAEVSSSSVPLGRGFVECRHGRLPLPAPAALGCLRGVPTTPSGLEVELVTPTGAAILATVATSFAEWPSLSPERIGWGAGTRGLPDRPNALRMVLGAPLSLPSPASHYLLEANVDDMTGEVAAHALKQVLEAGALDVWMVPATMKKGRPGLVFSALAAAEQSAQVTSAILRETSTIGVRQTAVGRTELSRRMESVDTPWGPVRLKITEGASGESKAKPELDDCALIAKREDLPLRQVIDTARRLWKE